MKPENVELHIEELVLRGFAPGDRYRIGEAVERELARLFTEEEGVPPSLARRSGIERLDGGAFEVAHGLKPEAIGVQLAQAVFGGLSR
jgi:hypothetical protein